MESGKIDVTNEIFLFETFIEHIVELFSVATKEKKIKFIYNPESPLPYSLISDPTRLQQLLSNLLSNAIKFTPQNGEIIFSIKVLDILEDKVKISFLVKDSGIGMTSEQQKVIFNPFSQADDGISRKYGGTGLGLAICSDIAKLMNSEIELKSIPNEGSEFSFTIDFKIDKLKNEQKIVDENLKILLYCSDGNNDNLRQNIQNHVSKIGIISDYSNENRKGDILFCCGINNLDLVIEEFKTQNTKSQIIYVGDSSNITNNKIKEEINHYLELPIYGLKIYNILVQNTDIHKNIVKKSMEEQKFDGKILVAEDNPNNQKLLEILLTKMGIQTVIVSNGEEAVECYKKDKYDMILMDINMPIMDGITATKLIKDLEKDNYKIPIIALTANSIAGDEEKYLAQGMNNYLSKPINVAKLKELISIYLFSDEKL
jgi:CheY-like chemotaxis protein